MTVHSIRIVTPEEEQRWNDKALEDAATSPHFRIWLYRESAIVLGCAQRSLLPSSGSLDPDDMPVLIRRSGGGAVLVGPWLVGVSAWIPDGHPLLSTGLAESYRWLGEAHVATLSSIGVTGHAVPPAMKPDAVKLNVPSVPLDWACFGDVSAWEIVAGGGRKISGFAQIRRRTGALFVGATLVWKSPWELMCSQLGYGYEEAKGLRNRTISCGEITGDRNLAACFAQSLSGEMNDRMTSSDVEFRSNREVVMT